jgi:hypothetical protein
MVPQNLQRKNYEQDFHDIQNTQILQVFVEIATTKDYNETEILQKFHRFKDISYAPPSMRKLSVRKL